MLGRVLDLMTRLALRRLTCFPEQQGEEARRISHEVGRYFGSGANARFRGLSSEAVAKRAREVPWQRRLFFWEGFAFALAGLHALRFRRGNPDGGRLVPHYRAMHYTGYGFWNGLARLHYLPRISLRPEHWADVGDFTRLAPVISGGSGFVVTASAGALDGAVLRILDSSGLPGPAHAAVRGCGRALWFLYMDNVERLEQVFAAHAGLRDDLVEGVGVAMGFTRLAEPGRMVATVERFPPATQAGLLRGVGTALYQGVEEDPELKDRITSIQEARLRHVYEVCAGEARQTKLGPTWYPDWEARLRLALP